MQKLREQVLLSQFSNYKIGGNARFFFEPKNEEEIEWAVREAKSRDIPIFILGGATNLLINDEGFDGLVIRPSLHGVVVKGNTMTVGAGATMHELLDAAIDHAFSGLEWAGGLPGTLGGAIRGNAGCFGGEIKDVVASVRSFNMTSMGIVERDAAACAFGYRDSIFKHTAADEIIVSATLTMGKSEKKKIKKAIKEKIEHREKNHPLDYPNIGSIFKNVPLSKVHKEKSKKYQAALAGQSVAFRGSQFSVKNDPFPVISAAKLISETGLRGVSFGGAMISPKHPNFIVNALGAAAIDVKSLIMLAKAEVKKKFGVELEEEIQMV